MKLALLIISIMSFSFLFSQEKEQNSHLDTSYVIPSQEMVDISILTPPVGFENSPQFNGYISYQNGAAIMISLLTNVNFLKLDEGMNKDFFDKNKLTFLSKKDVQTTDGTSGINYEFNFTLEGVEFVRNMVYLGDLNNTLWLNITYPKSVERLMKSEIDSSIASVKFKTLGNEDK